MSIHNYHIQQRLEGLIEQREAWLEVNDVYDFIEDDTWYALQCALHIEDFLSEK